MNLHHLHYLKLNKHTKSMALMTCHSFLTTSELKHS